MGSNGSRLTLTANQQFKLLRVATITAEAKGTFISQNQSGLGLSPLSKSYNMVLPYNPLADASGQGIDYSFAFYAPKLDQLEAQGYQPYRYNFLTERDIRSDKTTENNYWGSLNASVPLLPGLTANGLVSVERTFGEHQVYNAPGSYYTRDLVNRATSYDATTGQLVYGLPPGAVYSPYQFGRNNYTLRGQLTFDREFGGRHQLNALAGSEIRQTQQTSDTQTLYGYNDQSQAYAPVDYRTPYTDTYGISQRLNNLNGVADRTYRFLSYFANGSYTLLGRYTASGSVRYDDYNNLGLDRSYRATPFYSAGLAWALSQESWLKERAWLSSLRLRSTYGLTGNIPAGAYPNTAISLATNDVTTGQSYTIISSPANPTLRWERTAVTNVGLDFSLFNDRLTGTVEVYDKRSRDLFLEYPTNPTYGFSLLTRNAAQLDSRGVDITLGGSPVRTTDWEWSVSSVLGYNTNRITDFSIDNTATVAANGGSGILAGYALNSLFVFRSAGLDNTGRQQVYDHNEGIVNSFTAVTSLADLHYAGRTTAPYSGGLNQTVRYKGLSLYVQLVGKFDYVFVAPTFGSTPTTGRFTGYDLNADLDKRWRQPGDEATTTVVGLNGATGNSYVRYYYSDQRVQRADHVRLREVALRYSLPNALLSHVGLVKGISLSVAARNIGLLWRKNDLGIDPDFLPNTQQVKLSPAVSFVFGLNASF